MFGTLQIMVWIVPYFLKDPLERAGAFAFAMGTCIHTAFFFNSTTDIYYLSAIGLDVGVVMILAVMRYSDFNYTLALISMGAATTNFGGLICAKIRCDPLFYDISYIIMYFAVVALFLTGGSDGRGVDNPFLKDSTSRPFVGTRLSMYGKDATKETR